MTEQEKDLQVIQWTLYRRGDINPTEKLNEWVDVKDIKYEDTQTELVTTTGFKVKEDNIWVTLAASIRNGLAQGITTIFKPCIVNQYTIPQTQPKTIQQLNLDRTAYTNVIDKKIEQNKPVNSPLVVTRPSNLGGPNKVEIQKSYRGFNVPEELRHVDMDKFWRLVNDFSVREMLQEMDISQGLYYKVLTWGRQFGFEKVSKNTFPSTLVKREADEFDILDAYEKGMTWDEITSTFSVSRQDLSKIINQGKKDGLIHGRKTVKNTGSNKFPCAFKKPNSNLDYVYKGPYKGTFDVQWVIDNYSTHTNTEISKEIELNPHMVKLILDYMHSRNIIPNFGQVLDGSVCKNRNPFVAYGINVYEFAKAFKKNPYPSRLATQFNIHYGLAEKLIDVAETCYGEDVKQLMK